MTSLPRVHWIYGPPCVNKLRIVENEINNKEGTFVNIDFDILKRRYVCKFATFLGTKYMGEKNAIIDGFEIISDDKLEMARIRKLMMLFHPSVCRMQLIDFEKWKVDDIYLISCQSPKEFYERLPRSLRPTSFKDFYSMLNVVKHVKKVIELPI